ncbi:hypothetical protein GCM10011512_08970 [Tersicoccus solisilvae]|uniref:Phosphatidate phosphatase APP1 catalytic domain-containing protein n=1 Tax=Tersicoccus solisilvae TaxID=1882339 RepID=A0ABQ1NTF4_9MICC|nr:phosphatase domain-containing protein [Tersicoccus solisilvae]GGC84355.1 hypothetical protein GCM10011512_08970 [Tersicoccus solisilvae]
MPEQPDPSPPLQRLRRAWRRSDGIPERFPEAQELLIEAKEQASNIAYRVEERVHAWREGRARRRNFTPTVVPSTGYGTTSWIRVLGRAVMTRERLLDRFTGEDVLSVRGWRSFLSIPIADAVVTVRIGDTEVEVTADHGGVIDVAVDVDLPPGWHEIGLSTEGSTPQTAQVHVVADEQQIGVVSDIDDTVMVTALPRPMLAAWNTFVLDEHARTPTPGMAVLYERLHRQYAGAAFLYLSTGAWNVAPTLRRFLSRNLYPDGPLLLTDWGPTHERWFRSGQQHKVNSLRRLAEEFPHVKWILIGDDGQHDPAIYGEFARRYPQNVAAVCIRELSASEAVLAGGLAREPQPMANGVQWLTGPDGRGLAAQLADAGLLDPDRGGRP